MVLGWCLLACRDLCPFWALGALGVLGALSMVGWKNQCWLIPTLTEKEAPPLLTSDWQNSLCLFVGLVWLPLINVQHFWNRKSVIFVDASSSVSLASTSITEEDKLEPNGTMYCNGWKRKWSPPLPSLQLLFKYHYQRLLLQQPQNWTHDGKGFPNWGSLSWTSG